MKALVLAAVAALALGSFAQVAQANDHKAPAAHGKKGKMDKKAKPATEAAPNAEPAPAQEPAPAGH